MQILAYLTLFAAAAEAHCMTPFQEPPLWWQLLTRGIQQTTSPTSAWRVPSGARAGRRRTRRTTAPCRTSTARTCGATRPAWPRTSSPSRPAARCPSTTTRAPGTKGPTRSTWPRCRRASRSSAGTAPARSGSRSSRRARSRAGASTPMATTASRIHVSGQCLVLSGRSRRTS